MPPEPANDGGRPTPRTIATGSRCDVECGGPSEGGALSLMGEVNAGRQPAQKLFFFLKTYLLSALSVVGAVRKAYTSNEILSLLKAYVVQHSLLDATSQTVKCKGTSLEDAFQVPEFQFEYSVVRRLLSKHVICASYVRPATSPTTSLDAVSATPTPFPAAVSTPVPVAPLSTAAASHSTPLSNTPAVNYASILSPTSTPTFPTTSTHANTSVSSQSSSSQVLKRSSLVKFKIPEIPDSQSEPESDYSYQGYETSLCQLSDGSVTEEEEEELVEYEPVSEEEEENGSNTHNDSDSDAENGLLLILGMDVPQDFDEDFFADESDSPTESESDGHTTEDETDRWPCVKCGIRNKPFMRYCLKCWQVRKDWYPDPPQRRKKRKPRPKKDRRRKLDRQPPLDLQRTSSIASTSSAATSTTTFFSSQESGFVSQDLVEEEEEERVEPRKRRFSDADSEKDDVEPKAKRAGGPSKQSGMRDFKNMVDVHGMGDVPYDQDVKVGTDSVNGAQDYDGEGTYGGSCSLCCTRPKNASIIHGRISHISFCYPCAKRLYNSKSKCPICRRKIHMVTRNIIH